MHRLSIAACAFLCCCAILATREISAQEAARMEVSLGWGVYHYPGFPGFTTYLSGSDLSGFRSPFSPGSHASFTGPLTAGIYGRVGRRWWVGFAASYMRLRAAGVAYVGGNRIAILDEHRYSRLCIAGEAKLDYIKQPMFRVYARFGLGLDFVDYKYRYVQGRFESHGSLQPAVHISPLGVSVGGRLRGCVEGGLGYRGIIALGAAYGL